MSLEVCDCFEEKNTSKIGQAILDSCGRENNTSKMGLEILDCCGSEK